MRLSVLHSILAAAGLAWSSAEEGGWDVRKLVLGAVLVPFGIWGLDFVQMWAVEHIRYLPIPLDPSHQFVIWSVIWLGYTLMILGVLMVAFTGMPLLAFATILAGLTVYHLGVTMVPGFWDKVEWLGNIGFGDVTCPVWEWLIINYICIVLGAILIYHSKPPEVEYSRNLALFVFFFFVILLLTFTPRYYASEILHLFSP